MKIALKFASSLLFAAALVGCSTAINTTDVTKIVVTTTGIKIGKGEVSQTPELTLGRNQVEYIKVPPTTNGTPQYPNVVSRYEANAHSAVFGNASATSTLAVGEGINTQVGGATPPINNQTGTGNKLPTANPVGANPGSK